MSIVLIYSTGRFGWLGLGIPYNFSSIVPPLLCVLCNDQRRYAPLAMPRRKLFSFAFRFTIHESCPCLPCRHLRIDSLLSSSQRLPLLQRLGDAQGRPKAGVGGSRTHRPSCALQLEHNNCLNIKTVAARRRHRAQGVSRTAGLC